MFLLDNAHTANFPLWMGVEAQWRKGAGGSQVWHVGKMDTVKAGVLPEDMEYAGVNWWPLLRI